jgi:hypothetical protein
MITRKDIGEREQERILKLFTKKTKNVSIFQLERIIKALVNKLLRKEN